MTPDELRLLTDPAARNDPEFLRRVRDGARRERRNRVFGTLRIGFGVTALIGVTLSGVSFLLVVGALLSPYVPGISVPAGALHTGAFLGMFALLMLGLAVWMFPGFHGLLTSGVAARARIVQVLDLRRGMSIKSNGLRASVATAKVQLEVVPPQGAPYSVVHSQRILDTDIASLQVGATVQVRISPSNPQRLLIDWDA